MLGADRHSTPLQLANDRGRRCLVKTEEVHRQLHAPAAELEHKGLHTSQAAGRLPQGTCEASSVAQLHAGKDDVESEQRVSSADADGAGRWMRPGTTKRRPRAARPNVRERVLLAVTVEVDGNVQLSPYPFAQSSRYLVGIGERSAFKRHDWKDIGRSNPRVHPPVFAQVYTFHCHLHGCEQCLDDVGFMTHQRDDDSVVVHVGVDVDDVCVGGSSSDLGNDLGSVPF